MYYRHFQERAMGRGEVLVRGSVYPPGRECKWLRGFMGSITGRILKNLRATISEGKDMNFPA